MRVLAQTSLYRIAELEGPVLFVQIHGSADTAAIDEFFGRFQPLLVERAPARILVDAAGLADATLSGRWNLAMRMKENRPYIARSAVYGLGPRTEVIARVLLRASGRRDVRTFSDRDSALGWLRGATMEPAASPPL